MAYTMLSDPNVDDTKQVEAHLLAALEVFTKDEDSMVHAHIFRVLDVARQRLKGSSDK